MMAYAYGILEKAEKDVNIKKDLLNSIEKMRKHYIKKQSNTIKTAADNKVSIEKKNEINYSDLDTLSTVIYNLLKAQEYSVSFDSILHYLTEYQV
jgi:metal-responsive CopG/Arc/MetJ family transcriptional regulator